MFGGWNGSAKSYAALAERLTALEIRLASLATEVQPALAAVKVQLEGWEAREAARLAGLHDATDKLRRVTERARKAGELRADREQDDDDWDWSGILGKRGLGEASSPNGE
jgi:hypothetical protein